jgi:hypothetical protein
MAIDKSHLSRRHFLRQGATLGLGALIGPAVSRTGFAASKERAVVYQGVSLDSLHPYGYSGGGINGIWLHLIEPLIVMDYTRQNSFSQRRAANLQRRRIFHRAHENR